MIKLIIIKDHTEQGQIVCDCNTVWEQASAPAVLAYYGMTNIQSCLWLHIVL